METKETPKQETAPEAPTHHRLRIVRPTHPVEPSPSSSKPAGPSGGSRKEHTGKGDSKGRGGSKGKKNGSSERSGQQQQQQQQQRGKPHGRNNRGNQKSQGRKDSGEAGEGEKGKSKETYSFDSPAFVPSWKAAGKKAPEQKNSVAVGSKTVPVAVLPTEDDEEDPVAFVRPVPQKSPSMTPPPPSATPSLWLVNKEAFRNEQQTRSRLLVAMGNLTDFPSGLEEGTYPSLDVLELCNALGVSQYNLIGVEKPTQDKLVEDALLVLAYALEQCNEHVYIPAQFERYLCTVPAKDKIKPTINKDSDLVSRYMNCDILTELNVDWATGELKDPIFREGVKKEVPAEEVPEDGKKKGKKGSSSGPYDGWMEKLEWDSLNKTRQLYIQWNNYFVMSGRRDIFDVATDAYGIEHSTDPDAVINELRASGKVQEVGQLPYRLPVWNDMNEWKKAPESQRQRHIEWRAYEHSLCDGHIRMVERLTRVFGEPWTVRNSIHHLGKFLKQFREVVRIKESLNHIHEENRGLPAVSDRGSPAPEVPLRSTSPALPALSSVAHVIQEMRKVIQVCGPRVILLPQFMALTSVPLKEGSTLATLNGTRFFGHPVFGRILPHASRILLQHFYKNSLPEAESPILSALGVKTAAEAVPTLFSVSPEQIEQYNLVRVLWAVQQVAVDGNSQSTTLAIVFRNEIAHACEHAELGFRDGYKIACAIHGFLTLPPSRPSSPSRAKTPLSPHLGSSGRSPNINPTVPASPAATTQE